MSDEKLVGHIKEGWCFCGKRILERIELGNRRTGHNFEFSHAGLRYIASTRLAKPGAKSPAEVFLNCAKSDSEADLVARDAAVLLSVALQYGVPLSALATSALGRDADGVPSSPIGKLLDILYKGTQ